MAVGTEALRAERREGLRLGHLEPCGYGVAEEQDAEDAAWLRHLDLGATESARVRAHDGPVAVVGAGEDEFQVRAHSVPEVGIGHVEILDGAHRPEDEQEKEVDGGNARDDAAHDQQR